MVAATATTEAPTRRNIVARTGLQLVGVVIFVAFLPIAFGMEWRNFLPLFNPDNMRFLGFGLLATVLVSIVAIVASLPLATGLALGRLSHIGLIRWPSIAIIEFIRAMPVLLLIYYINLRFPGLDMFSGFQPGPRTDYLSIEIQRILARPALAVTAALTIYTAAVNAELLRSGILSLERGQFEASRALGLSYWQMMRRVILPQAFRRTLAPLIAQFTIVVKDTSLGSIIGFFELQRRGVIIYQVPANFNPMETLYVIALVYFVVNYLLGLTSRLIERRRPSVRPVVEA